MDPSKGELRTELRRRLAGVRMTDARAWSLAACRHAFPLLEGRRRIMLYVPMAGELDVRPLAVEALDRGLTICIPKVDWDRGKMTPFVVQSLDEPVVVRGQRGVFDPAPGATKADPDSIDLVFVPGLAFDERGGRLGRGSGFYDRFLHSTGLPSCGVAFEMQVIAQVPRDPHDASVGSLVTDERLLTGLGRP